MPSITVCPTALTVFLEGNALYDPCQNQTQLFLKVSVLKRLGTAIFLTNKQSEAPTFKLSIISGVFCFNLERFFFL